jgi:hypothetical protein
LNSLPVSNVTFGNVDSKFNIAVADNADLHHQQRQQLKK